MELFFKKLLLIIGLVSISAIALGQNKDALKYNKDVTIAGMDLDRLGYGRDYGAETDIAFKNILNKLDKAEDARNVAKLSEKIYYLRGSTYYRISEIIIQRGADHTGNLSPVAGITLQQAIERAQSDLLKAYQYNGLKRFYIEQDYARLNRLIESINQAIN